MIESSPFSDSRKLIREKIIPWEGLARAGIISNDLADLIKVLETQNADSKRETVLNSVELYTKTILSLLNKLDVNSRDDVLKSVLVLINDLLVDPEAPQFLELLVSLSDLDSSLPFSPFVKHLDNNDTLIQSLSAYNLVILLSRIGSADKEVVIKVFDVLSSKLFIGNVQDTNLQSIGVQLLQELVINKLFRAIYQEHNLVSNFKSLAALVETQAKLPNSANLQLVYNALVTTWVLSFNSAINKVVVHHYPQLVGNLLAISKELIKLKVVRVAVSTLKNFVSVTTSNAEQFSVVKLVLFHDGLNVVSTIQTRKFASNGSDEELSNDLAYLSDTLNDVVARKLSSMDEYLVELENPNLLSWSSPTHKSSEFWQNNAHKFKDGNYALIKKIMTVLSNDSAVIGKVILLSDLQFLIKNLGLDLIGFINSEKHGQYKLLIMNFLENSDGNNELKYEALRTIQYLVGHA